MTGLHDGSAWRGCMTGLHDGAAWRGYMAGLYGEGYMDGYSGCYMKTIESCSTRMYFLGLTPI